MLHDGQPRFKLTETYWRWWRGPEIECLILDRGYCHEVVWRARSGDLRGGGRALTYEERIEAVRRRARGALYEIEAECGG